MISFDLTNAPDGFKGAILNVFLLPFWYITFYLFHKEFFLSQDFVLIMSFCICFTIVSTILTFIMASFNKLKPLPLYNTVSSADVLFNQMTVHSFLIVLFYIAENFLGGDANFLLFLGTYFGLMIFFTILAYFENQLKNKNDR